MSKSDPELKRIVGWVIGSGYSELRKLFMANEITLVYTNLKNEYATVSLNGGYNHKITFDRTLEYASRGVKVGVSAHECEHLSEELQFNREDAKIDRQLRRFRLYREKDGRSIDLKVVMRGFGKELLEFKKFAEERNGEREPDCGLSSKEIEKLLKI